jgi:hypothetical protein
MADPATRHRALGAAEHHRRHRCRRLAGPRTHAPSALADPAATAAPARAQHRRGRRAAVRRGRRAAGRRRTSTSSSAIVPKVDTAARLLHGVGSTPTSCTPPASSTRRRSGSSTTSTPTARATWPMRPAMQACVGSCTCRRTARSAPTRPQRHVPPRRAVPPVPGLRRLEDAGRDGRVRSGRRRARRHIVRPPWFYGPFQPPRQTTFFRMVRNGKFPVIGRASSAARWSTSTTWSTASSPPSWCPRLAATATGSPTSGRTRSPRSSRPSVGRWSTRACP